MVKNSYYILRLNRKFILKWSCYDGTWDRHHIRTHPVKFLWLSIRFKSGGARRDSMQRNQSTRGSLTKKQIRWLIQFLAYPFPQTVSPNSWKFSLTLQKKSIANHYANIVKKYFSCLSSNLFTPFLNNAFVKLQMT